MSEDENDDDDVVGRVPPLPPDDRLWRHPSEVSSFGHGRIAPPPATTAAQPSGRPPTWPIALVAAFVGAALCGGVLAVTGNLSVDPDRVVERVKVSPQVPAPALTDGESMDAITARVSRSVVRLVITTPQGRSSACGVVVRDDGVVVTSAHEVADASAIVVVLSDGRKMEGKLVGADLPTDVGVISIHAGALTVAVLGSSEDLEAGAITLAMGATNDGDSAVSTGVISSLGERLDAGDESLHGMIKTDAPIESAWSGGPLVDATGAVIGITTDLAGDGARFGFATPIELVRNLTDELLAYGKVSHGWLGIEGADLSDAKADLIGIRWGAEVRQVLAGSPAGRAGLASGDVITELGDDAIHSSTDLVVALRSHKPGEVVVLGYWRGGRHHEAEVTIDHAPL
ncbi:MAG: S1C family serine protease [Acidimicrobiales bacterium]